MLFLIKNERENVMDNGVRNIEEVTTEDEKYSLQDEYFKRLERITKDFNKTLRTIARCATVVICFWILGYFLSPYLTKNFSYIKSSGDVKIEGGVNKNVGSDMEISLP